MHNHYDHRLWYTDIEPAYEKPAECDCHHRPHDNMCICVTSADRDNWNSAYNAVSSIVEGGIDMSAISSAAKLMTSANYWNSTYETVSVNSATWQQISEFEQQLYVTSADLDVRVKELSARKIYTDQDTITGDGTVSRPLGVSYKDQIDSLIDQYMSLTGNATDLQKLGEAMAECKADLLRQIAELSGGHVQNYDLIRQILGLAPAAGNRPEFWIEDETMRSNNAATYKNNAALNRMYYSTYTGNN